MTMRIGCLAALILFALLGVYLQLANGFGEEGGGKFALLGLMGVVAAVVTMALGSLARRRGPNQRGFPIEPRPPDGDA